MPKDPDTDKTIHQSFGPIRNLPCCLLRGLHWLHLFDLSPMGKPSLSTVPLNPHQLYTRPIVSYRSYTTDCLLPIFCYPYPRLIGRSLSVGPLIPQFCVPSYLLASYIFRRLDDLEPVDLALIRRLHNPYPPNHADLTVDHRIL